MAEDIYSKRVMLKFTEDEAELVDLVDSYRRSLGWTWKRFFLIGVAEAVSKNKDNQDLALAIAEHLMGKR